MIPTTTPPPPARATLQCPPDEPSFQELFLAGFASAFEWCYSLSLWLCLQRITFAIWLLESIAISTCKSFCSACLSCDLLLAVYLADAVQQIARLCGLVCLLCCVPIFDCKRCLHYGAREKRSKELWGQKRRRATYLLSTFLDLPHLLQVFSL